MAESLKLTIKRTLPYWNNVIVPQIKVTTNSPKDEIFDLMSISAGRQEDHHRRPRELAARCGEAPGQHVRRGHHGAQPAHRHPLRLRARREHEANRLYEVPWR